MFYPPEWGTERLNRLPTDTQLVSSRAGAPSSCGVKGRDVGASLPGFESCLWSDYLLT